ncbi:hypothetical protein [Caudoviricetes sp.]|nr:hypothetical protein [Caudoviricetes sp.]
MILVVLMMFLSRVVGRWCHYTNVFVVVNNYFQQKCNGTEDSDDLLTLLRYPVRIGLTDDHLTVLRCLILSMQSFSFCGALVSEQSRALGLQRPVLDAAVPVCVVQRCTAEPDVEHDFNTRAFRPGGSVS